MEIRKILVVYDPTRSDQPALARAASIAMEIDCELHVFVSIHLGIKNEAGRSTRIRELIDEQSELLREAVRPVLERGIRVMTEVEWDKDWCSAVVRASIRHQADVVLKSSCRHSVSARFLNRTSDWTLIRECLCPVLLIKEGQQRGRRKVLAAIDIRGGRESYPELNQHIIDFSRRVMDSRSAEVHFINAFKDLESIPDRNTLLKSCGVNSGHIHIQMGEPADVILQGARELGVSLVVVGNSARSGFSAVIDGNTVERVLDKLDCDVLSMPRAFS